MRAITLLVCSAALAGLSGCATDGYYGEGYYGSSFDYGSPYAYNGWYDGYYGPIYDGYWGRDGYFYYRTSDRDRNFRRGGRDHFARSQSTPGTNYREMRGNFTPRREYRMPSYPHEKHGNGYGDHHHDRDH